MEKVLCSNCKQMTALASHCMFCGAAIEQRGSTLAEDASYRESAVFRATVARRDLEKFVIARISLGRQLPDGSFPGLKRLVVQNGHTAIVLADGHAPVTLGPGRYQLSRAGITTSPLKALMADVRGGLVSFCTAVDTVFPVTFLLPDHRGIQDNVNEVERAYQALSLRTADNLLGGVEVRLELRCVDPLKLQVNLVRLDDGYTKHREEIKDVIKDEQRPQAAARLLTMPLEVVGKVLFGGSPGDRDLKDYEFRASDLYERIRNEFAMAVRAAIRNESVNALYDTVEVRERVAGDVARDMSASFDRFGLRLEQISAFHFNCPDYDRLLAQRGQVAIEQEQLRDRRTRARVEREARDVSADEARHVTASEEETERLKLEEQARTSETRDRATLEGQQRELMKEGERREFERSQRAADESKRLELQLEKARGYLEVQKEAEGARLERSLRRIEAFAKLPPEQILSIALAENPQLTAAFVAAKQAEGRERQVEMQERFRQELTGVLGQDRAMVNTLMNEAVKQLGTYMAARAEAGRPQIIPNAGARVLRIEGQSSESPAPPQPDVDEGTGDKSGNGD